MTEQHRLTEARWLPSPNTTPRPAWALPELIVLHCISLPEGVYGTEAPHRLFQGVLDVTEHPSFVDLDGVEVSSHLLIERDGSVVQFVTFDQQAYHAGLSIWHGRSGCNPFSIGIELEGVAGEAFTADQYDALRGCLLALLRTYPSLSVANIVGHSEIAPERKVDPGTGFDWSRVLKQTHADMSLYLKDIATT